MHAKGVQAVIVAQPTLDRGGGPETHRPRDQPDGQRRPRQHETRRRRNGHQPGNCAGNRAENGRFPTQVPLREGPAHGRTCRGDLGDQHRHAGAPIGAERAAGVEAHPADPQQAGADHRVCQVIRRHVFLPVAKPLPQHQGADQAGDAAVYFHDCAAGEVGDTHDGKPAVGAPDPMRQRGVDQQRPQREEHQHGGELHPVGAASCHHGRRDDGESHLEHDEHALGDRGRLCVGRAGAERKRLVPPVREAIEEQAREIADPGIAIAESEGITRHHPHHRHRRAQAERLHHDREHVLLTHHAGIKQRQAGYGHQQHQHGADQHPRDVACLDMWHPRVPHFACCARTNKRANINRLPNTAREADVPRCWAAPIAHWTGNCTGSHRNRPKDRCPFVGQHCTRLS